VPRNGVELFRRDGQQPLLSPDKWPYPVNAVFNPGATIVDGETVLLVRVEDRQGRSHITVARSADGLRDWRIDGSPLIGVTDDRSGSWGAEDPRITKLEEQGVWLIAYTAYGPGGPSVALAVTQDFRSVERIGVVMPPEDKNAALLSRHINGEFVLLHRPTAHQSGRADVWLSRSLDLRSWTAPEPVLRARPSVYWDSVRVGIGPPPLETEHGWLCLYHGVKGMVGGPVYRIGLALLDLENPAIVRHRSEDWVMAPTAPYERVGDVANTIFPTGLVIDPASGRLRVYYGAADSVVASATADLTEVLEYVRGCPPPAADHA
jgi:predicted GH43/DUF377 family glycosyl hydrolase